MTFEGAEGEEYKPQTFDINEKATKPADPDEEYAIFGGWFAEGAEETFDFANTAITADITLIAKWIDDVNNNNVLDDNESFSVAVIVEENGVGGEVTVSGATEIGDGKYAYDSLNGATVSVIAKPVIEDGNSKSYVSEIKVDAESIALKYNEDYSVTYEFTVEGSEIATAADLPKTVEITFTDCGFIYDEDGQMRFYVGMEDPDYETLYNAVITSPEYVEGAVTAKYLARPAATYQMQVPVLFEYTIPLINYEIKIGGDTVDIDLDDAWLDVGESFKTLTPEELQKQYDTELQKIKDKIAAIDLTDITWSNAEDKVQQFGAIREELNNLIETMKNEATYLGYHQFGASSLVDENGNAQEILQIIYDNGAMHLQDEEVTVTLVDDRIATTITGGNLTFEYDEFTDESIMDALVLTDVDGNAIEGNLTKYVDLAGTEVGSCTYTVNYAGSWDYKPCTVEFTLTVIKAPSNVDVLDQNITYPAKVSAPVITNKHGAAIDIDAIEFILGLDVAALDIDGDGVKGLEGRMQLILTDELQTILAMVGLEEGVELNISDLISMLTNTGLLEQWGVTSDMVNTLKGVLDAINGVVEANNLLITIGGEYPSNVGAYLHGAVTVDANYETSYDVGYILIKPATTEYTLEWNESALTNGVVTLPAFNTMDKGAHAVGAEDFEVSYVILGVNSDTSDILSTDVYGNIKANIWLNNEELKDNGAYLQIAYGINWGNEFDYAMPIVRSFLIVPALYDVQLVGATGEPNDELLKTFNNEQQGFSVIVKDNKGDVIYSDHYQNVVELRENAQLVVNYVGVQTNGQPYNSNEKPVHAGVYAATAVYMEFNDGQMLDISNLDVEDLYELFDLADIGADMGLLVIEPAESTIDVEDKIVAWDGTHYVFADQVTATSPAGVNPDKTIISAGINTDGDFSENGWAAVGGTVNVDFPRWIDELIAQYAPSVVEGISAKEFSDKLVSKLPSIAAKLEELGATNETLNALSNAVTSVAGALENIPENVKLSFKDDAYASSVGAYVIIGIVTDSDHIPAADAGILVILPEVDVVDLKWNHEDANNIWTRELLEQYDLWAKAYDKESGELDAGATAVIHYQFIGMDKNGSLLVIDTDNANDLPNGVYTELAYIELEIDGHMYISDMIARTVIIVPNAAEVKFVDVNGNNARRFVFDNTQKTMDVTVALNGKVITPAAGTLTFTYNGIQTNGKTYNSTTAPVHAGIYTVLAEYADYTEGGSLAHYGAAAGIMAIEPAASTMDVTGGTVTYDGEGHTATVVATGSGVTEPDYTLISGGAYVSGDINEVGVDAFHGNVNIDFPAWLDKALAEHEFKTEGVDTAYLTDFISSYRDDALALIPVEALVKLGIAEEEINAYIAKLNGYIDELLAVLEKLPADVELTFNDDVTYTEPGYYFYYGIVTDSDHYPSADTGLLVIEKKEILFDLLDTKATWNGMGQMVDQNNPENADFTTVVIDRKNNTINIILDEDAQYVLNAVAKLLGVEFDGDVQMSTILDKYNGKEVAAAIVELINEAQKLELPEEIRKVLDAVKAELETLPTSGTITVNGELPTELGVYEVYAISYSQHFKTTAAEAELEIVPVRVEVILNEVSKVYGEEDPELTYTVKYYDHEGNEMTGVDANITVQISREAGEDVGTYDITGTVILGDNTHFELIKQPDASEFTITKATDNTWTEEPGIEGWTYGETAKTPTGEAKYGEIKVEYRPADDPDAPFTTTVPTDAGDYIVRFTVEDTDNYNGITVEKELTIAKADSKITEEPKAVENLVYDGQEQELITAGTAEGGKLVYSLSENGPFSEEIPVGKEAGAYTVYYKVAGDNNHNDSEVKSITVKIKEDHTGEYPIPFDPEKDTTGTIKPGATVDIDGTPVVLDEDCIAWVKNTDAKIVTTYKYHEGDTVNETYPTNMYVWYLTMVNTDADEEMDEYKAERIPELDNLFEYNGASIRVGAAKNGIRFFTSMNPGTRTALQNGTLINTGVLKGAKMDRAGTVFKKNPEVQVTLENGVSSDVYGGKAGSNFRVFGTYSGRNWFTGMLVGLDTDAETVTAGIAARPYAQLQIGNETVVIYGGQIQRSIYYVATQNKDTFAQGSAYDQFVEGLIAKGNSIRGEE